MDASTKKIYKLKCEWNGSQVLIVLLLTMLKSTLMEDIINLHNHSTSKLSRYEAKMSYFSFFGVIITANINA